MKKILFLAAHRPDRSPAQRYRFEQYLTFLEGQGFQCDLSFIISANQDIGHKQGMYFQKITIVLSAMLKRFGDVFRSKRYDVVFIQREAFMLGTAIFERLLKMAGAKIIFDFDDAIWLPDSAGTNQKLSLLKKPSKTAAIISLSDAVIAGNRYLADYARRYNSHVSVIPTTIDTDRYRPFVINGEKPFITIGWTGSYSTIKHFVLAIPALEEIQKKFGKAVSFELIGDPSYEYPPLSIRGKAWKKETEQEDLSRFDIGIMPLPDDEWSRGKCGLKGLQYMAMGIPCIMSPVGVNTDIVKDGVNGFLATSHSEWVEKLSLLIMDGALRKRLGLEGRKTVVEKYSVESQKKNYLSVINNLITP